MILGMSVATFTLLHVILSLVGIVTGWVVLRAMLAAELLGGWTAVFLATTVLTSATGFLFPTATFDPAKVVGVISLVALAAALVARYGAHLAGAWRWIYVAGAVFALYLKLLRGRGAVVPEAAVPATAGADPVRTAVPDRAGRCVAGVHRRRHFRGAAVPPRPDVDGLADHLQPRVQHVAQPVTQDVAG